MNLRELQEKRSITVAEMRSMTEKPEGQTGDLSESQEKRFRELKTELAGVEKQIERQTFIDAADRRATSRPVAGNGEPDFDREARNFSLTRAIAHAAGLAVDAAREVEVSQELARRAGRAPEGFFAPYHVMEQRVVSSTLPTGETGGNLISTDFAGNAFIDRLRARMVVRQLGCRVLTGLQGNLAIPGLKSSATSGWVAENSALAASDAGFRQVSLTPKHCGGLTEVSRNMLLQASSDIEALLRDDLAAILAQAVDAAAINGAGGTEPVGVLGTGEISDVAMGDTGGTPTWAKVLDLIAALENANASGRAFLTNPSVVKKCRQTLKASGIAGYIMEDPSSLAGYPLASTTLVPSNLTKSTATGLSPLIFADWSDMIMGFWSQLDVLVNPYITGSYEKGNVQIRCMMTMDIALRHAESFAAIKDIVTA